LDCDDSFHSYIFAIGARIFNATLILASKDTTKNNIVSIIKKFTPSYFISSRLADLSMDGYSSKKYLNHYIYSKKSSDLLIHPDLSILFTTSGTTGSLKLCKVSNQNLRTSALQIIDSLSVTKSDRAITTLPLSYVYGFSILNSHLAAGSSLVINNASILTDVFWEVSRKYSVTNLNAVPFQFRMLKRIYRDHLSRNNNLRYVTQAGGPLDSDTALFIYSKSSY
jgi:acyl-coenzyme A synthetase/AMP-(fatty) acid ligase